MSSPSPQSDPDLERSGWTDRETNPFFASLARMWTKWEGAEYHAGLFCQANLLNGYGIMHGGAIAAVWDQLLGSAVADAVLAGTGKHAVTIQLNVNFLSQINEGDFMKASFRVPRQTRSLIFIDGTLTVGETTVSSVQSIFKLFTPKP